MQPDNQVRKNRIDQSRNIVWLTAFILAVLVVATVSVVGTCIYDYAHRSDCQISLFDGRISETTASAKNVSTQQQTGSVLRSQAKKYSGAQAKQQSENSSFQVKDSGQVWKTETAVDLFKASYKNADGIVTVKSTDGGHVVAPGTEGSYTFSLKNTGDASADYKIWVEAKLSSNMTGVPIETRMSGSDGWLLGNKNSWEQAESLNGVSTEETIDAGKTAEYTIDWQWPFEQDKDETDTDIANASVNQEMSYTVTIYTLTSASSSSGDDDQNNGNDQNAQNRQSAQGDQTTARHSVKTGDNTPVLLWAAVLVVTAFIVSLLFILKKRKNNRKNEQNES